MGALDAAVLIGLLAGAVMLAAILLMLWERGW